jgi:hypothetical protein
MPSSRKNAATTRAVSLRTASRACDRKLAHNSMWQESAALRDSGVAYVRYGSIATEAVEALHPWMSASARKRQLASKKEPHSGPPVGGASSTFR